MAAPSAARRSRPRTAQAIWRGAAFLVPLPFLLSFVVPALPAPAAAPIADLPFYEPFLAAPGTDEAGIESAAFILPDTRLFMLAALIAGWAVRFSLWLVSQVRLQALKSRSYPVNRPLRHWAEAMGLVRMPEVRIIPQGAPFLAGFLRPAVFLPAELTGDRIAYARALTRAARFARPVTALPVAAMVLKKEGTLKMRLNLLLTDDARPRRRGLAALAVLACAAPLAIAQGVLIRGPATGAATATITYAHPVLDKAKLTSAYGVRKHPVTGEEKLHGGVDLAEKEGTPIYAPAAGVVTRAEYDTGYGNLVEITTGDTSLRFGQLEAMSVKTGDKVWPGDTIATLGQSGTATGPHLHLEVLRGGERVDPQAEDGLVLAEVLRVQTGAAPLAPMTPQPTRGAPTPLPAVIPASAPLSAVGARLAQPYASAQPAPSPEECPEAARTNVSASLNTPDSVS